MLRILLFRTGLLWLLPCLLAMACELESASLPTRFVGPQDDVGATWEQHCASQPDGTTGQVDCDEGSSEGSSTPWWESGDDGASAEADAGDDSEDEAGDSSAEDDPGDADEDDSESDADVDSGESEGSDPVCGDGQVDAPEGCDGEDFAGQGCADFGHNAGELLCERCEISTELCHTCGDAKKDSQEACDVDDFGGATCVSLGFAGGVLNCSADCQTIDTSDCLEPSKCGNGVIETGEDCDGQSLGGQSCISLGFDEGQLACRGDCSFDLSRCRKRPCRKALQSCGGVNKCCPGLNCVLGVCL